MFGSNQLVQVDGQIFLRWEIIAIAFAARLLVLGVVYLMLRHFKYKVQLKDSIVLTIIFLIAFTISVLANFNLLNLARLADLAIYISSGVLAAVFMMIFMYAKNVLYLREQEQRDKVQDFVSILIENNCVPEEPKNGRRTAKPDKFLHGFGISNMKKAAEKYDGTCTTAQKNGKFTLKILIPNTNN